MFFGNHLPELIVLLVVALVVFGPKRLPEIGGAMGKGIREFRKGTSAGHDDSDHPQPSLETSEGSVVTPPPATTETPVGPADTSASDTRSRG